ncbi:conserved hypothetical protein [Thermotomaculum hydrothermale]|uniref:PEBP family protein n=1 Tax=Thermotomaculum hydrothermale TaxID=981385 RepID=A0A7R6SYS9_9BACT|nr:YbhB/YbcL family Raf kinase inhibitor-like protein [Thermotomaculum hydrothermale]BBB32042.1 conserved hypothetical protein [Thermotomaculum hydrothermale]
MKKTITVFLLLLCSNLLFSLHLKSPEFKNGGKIPEIFTCDGKDLSPELEITGIPKGTKSLVLIMDDPNAPMGTWVHWVVYNIPATVKTLKRDFPKKPVLPDGTTQGKNSWGKIGYGGPCPPKITGEHHYFFKLYAVDRKLNLPPGATKKEVLKAIKGHVRGRARLMGRYKRK